MADLIIDDEILQRLQDIAEREHRPVNDVLRTMVDKYPETPSGESSAEALLAMDGMFDDDVTHLSERSLKHTSNEVLLAMDGMFDDDITDRSSITDVDIRDYYRKKYADAD